VPDTETLNEAEEPSTTEIAAGWVVIIGAATEALTVRLAPLLVALPAELLTTTEYVPDCPRVRELSDRFDPVAPEIATPFLRHW
jgi:hypothetical protein